MLMAPTSPHRPMSVRCPAASRVLARFQVLAVTIARGQGRCAATRRPSCMISPSNVIALYPRIFATF
jgi:hypothetical protein